MNEAWSIVGATSSSLSVIGIVVVSFLYVRDEYLEVKNSSAVADAARSRIKNIRMTVLGATVISQIMNLLAYGNYSVRGCEFINVVQDLCDVVARFALYMFFLQRFVIISSAQLGAAGDPSFRRAIVDRKCTMIPVISLAVLASIFALAETSIENQSFVSNAGSCDSGLTPESSIFLVLFVISDLIVNITLFRLFMKPLNVMIVEEPEKGTAVEKQQFAVLKDLVHRNKVACYATIASTVIINIIYLFYWNETMNGIYNMLKPVDELVNCVAITYTYRRFSKMWSCQYTPEEESVKEETKHVDH
eukprot:TRINITY_DN4540_c0_g1_i3.p1 TRINITY_DN4540_c0_g1~~TRINITY_DN4540_c0_g1_i3.p1  ORF type:complete len:322 (-),score=74.28 TRINITY_DN4540_c0_g1_i3:703-1614(-)